MGRDNFWDSIVGRLYNYLGTVVSLSLAGLVDADELHNPINANLPIPERITGDWLKNKFFLFEPLSLALITTGLHKEKTTPKDVNLVSLSFALLP